METTHKPSEDSIEISDLGLAAALLCVGCVMLRTERNHANRVYFVFKNSEDLQVATKAYWINELDVSARSYFEATKSLKNLIYSGRHY